MSRLKNSEEEKAEYLVMDDTVQGAESDEIPKLTQEEEAKLDAIRNAVNEKYNSKSI